MISRPLFISVAESIVTFGPIDQFGWRSACSGVAALISSIDHVRNGPPDAVRIARLAKVVGAPPDIYSELQIVPAPLVRKVVHKLVDPVGAVARADVAYIGKQLVRAIRTADRDVGSPIEVGIGRREGNLHQAIGNVVLRIVRGSKSLKFLEVLMPVTKLVDDPG